MPYQNDFLNFWEQVKESVQEGNFAKLTMAKTIGKPELKNIFLRPFATESDFKVLLKTRYTSRDVDDKEEEHTLDDAFEIIKAHIKNPFFRIILFTTTQDLTFKVNKKGVATISQNDPTFREVILAKKDVE